MADCLLCGDEATSWFENDYSRQYFRCRRCGEFGLTDDAVSTYGSYRPEQKAQVAGTIREAHLLGVRRSLLSSDDVRRIATTPELDPLAKMDRLLLGLARVKPKPTTPYRLDLNKDRSLAFAADQQEMGWLLNMCNREGLISSEDYAPTAKGWARVRELKAGEFGSVSAFVAMPFDSSLSDVYTDGIAPAISAAGWSATRVDAVVKEERITDRIEVEIRRARFLIVDATLERPSVYWEAGFGRALGKPVIWMARDDHRAKLHFDTSAFHHIFWTNGASLVEPLRDRILATIGQGPLRR